MNKLTTLNTKLLLAAIAAVAALAGVAVVEMSPPEPVATAAKPAATAESKPQPGLQMWDTPKAVPSARFADETGKPVGLDSFHGKVLLVNFWATWCEPCKREMPSLLRLQQRLGAEDFLVVAVSGDRDGKAVVDPYIAEHNLSGLTILYDPMLTQARTLEVRGLPTTLLLSRDGRELGRAEGALEWDSDSIAGAVAGKIRGVAENAAPPPTN